VRRGGALYSFAFQLRPRRWLVCVPCTRWQLDCGICISPTESNTQGVAHMKPLWNWRETLY
jgi:hypothetical protein